MPTAAERARMAFICGLQARFSFGFASIASRALVSLLRNQNKNHSLLGATRFVA